MRRWNGWGNASVEVPAGPGVRRFLQQRLGPAHKPVAVSLAEVTERVQPSRLPSHPLVMTGAEERVRHARGQSLPDWIALRSGELGPVPDGVAYPRSSEDVRELLAFATRHGLRVIPYGGGTSVVGHHAMVDPDPPVLTVDLRRMNRLLHFDAESHLATFEAGVLGPDLEAALRASGHTLGHYPQSFEFSTLGGWICSRSSGQQSLGYGRIERLFAGGRFETQTGTLQLPPVPASGAGPDLKELILGSEGRYGILTEATMRVRRLPEREDFRALFFPDFPRGLAAVKALVRRRLPLTMMRLSNPRETAATLIMAGHEKSIALLDRYLRLRGAGENRCLFLWGMAGSAAEVRFAARQVRAAASARGGVSVGRTFGREWHKARFKSPYLRNALWEEGYAIDTFETALPWNRVEGYALEVEAGVAEGLSDLGEKVHVHTHLSHVYTDGCSVYTTYLFRLAPDPAENLNRWRRLKEIASRTIVRWGGTISHQHGVGRDHRPYLEAEKGAAGMVGDLLDPGQVMNPGKLF
jgi:alkyldihydroxyacetonephosphate synthase